MSVGVRKLNNPKIKIKDKNLMQRKDISEAVGWTQILKAMRLQWCYQICKSKNKVNGFRVSKETVVLSWWERSKQKFGFNQPSW